MTPPASLRNVSKLFGRFAALRHITLTLPPGHLFVLLGENGAGKSTLLRVLAGLLRPTLGEVLAFGQPPSAARGRIGYMSHAPMLYDEMTARENLAYAARLYATGSCLSPDEALETVGLDPSLPRYVAQYSQGMRQRASLARVLLSRPDLLLLDEPFSNMDRASAEGMVTLIGQLRNEGRTIMLTTHQRELVQAAADTVLTMHAGALANSEAR